MLSRHDGVIGELKRLRRKWVFCHLFDLDGTIVILS